ncbi:MAG: cysteine desulfurase [Saprospiraceae bacterium]|nr:cysteine desulfurase [Candidatus Opimibacter skivensis]
MSSPKMPVYLDYHATTPVDARVLESMLPWFTRDFGNPASRSHAYGWKASEAVEIARSQVADLLNTDSKSIIFTSGSTEGLNMAIKGLAENSGHIGKHIITVATEHHAVLDTIDWLNRKGYELSILPVDGNGILDIEHLRNTIRNDTIMVIVMWANNETGVVQDIKEIGLLCHQAGVPLVCDATQAAGKIDIDLVKIPVGMLAISAHKMYGPKGVGALYINPSMKVKPAALIHGGGHERGYRSGTLNVPGIVGLGSASALRKENLLGDRDRLLQLRDQFEKSILAALEEVSANGHVCDRLHTVSNLKVRFVDSQAVMSRFRSDLAISSGSACSSANPEPSHVLLAMGLTPAEAKGSFRISLGVPTTLAEIEIAARIFIEAVEAERAQSPVWQMFKQGIDVS